MHTSGTPHELFLKKQEGGKVQGGEAFFWRQQPMK
jgi:hypothetical protein